MLRRDKMKPGVMHRLLRKFPALVTAERLSKMGACTEQVERFAKKFKHGLELTPENLLLAAQGGMDLEWFVCSIGGERYDGPCCCSACQNDPREMAQAALEALYEPLPGVAAPPVPAQEPFIRWNPATEASSPAPHPDDIPF